MRRAAVAKLVLTCTVVLPLAGCILILGANDWQDVSCVTECGADSPVEEAASDSGLADSAIDSPSVSEAGDAGNAGDTSSVDAADAADAIASDAGDAQPANPYNPISDLSEWSKFDVSAVNASAKGFAGGAFDGRYVYLSPANDGAPDGVVARYDTTAAPGFTSAMSWSAFDTGTLDAGARGFLGCVYTPTNKELYLVPNDNGSADGVVAAYGTAKTFAQASSWTTGAVPQGDGGKPAGFSGGAFDGQFLYLAPNDNGSPDGVIARLDTTQPFGPGAWSTFDVTTVLPAAKGYTGAVYTGTLVLFVPTRGAAPSGVVAAYDTSLPFGQITSWLTFDLSGLDSFAKGFRGGAFDGRYVYLAPNNNGSLDGTVARYDTTHQLADPNGWSFFDATMVSASATGFWGGAFDGRYVYFVPNAGTLVLRVDTTAAFGSAASWSTFDTASLGAGVGQFAGAVFDGEYVYFIPAVGSIAVRFDARSPPAASGQPSSFY